MKFKVGDIVRFKNKEHLWSDLLFEVTEAHDDFIYLYSIEKDRVEDGCNLSAEEDELVNVKLNIDYKPRDPYEEFMKEQEKKKHDAVNHPDHYCSDPSGVECIEITKHRDFCVGNAIKYLWRCGLKKDADKSIKEKEIEDLKKAMWYINAKIDMLTNE